MGKGGEWWCCSEEFSTSCHVVIGLGVAACMSFFLAGAFQTLSKNCATCLGKFDALHLGHASLAQRAREDLQMEPGLTMSCLRADKNGELLTRLKYCPSWSLMCNFRTDTKSFNVFLCNSKQCWINPSRPPYQGAVHGVFQWHGGSFLAPRIKAEGVTDAERLQACGSHGKSTSHCDDRCWPFTTLSLFHDSEVVTWVT